MRASPGLTRKTKVEQVPLQPQGILNLNVQREVVAVRCSHTHWRQIDRDAVETIAEVLPTRCRNQNVDQWQRAFRWRPALITAAGRIGAFRDSNYGRSFVCGEPTRDEIS